MTTCCLKTKSAHIMMNHRIATDLWTKGMDRRHQFFKKKHIKNKIILDIGFIKVRFSDNLALTKPKQKHYG
jgi:hypothetical protein